MQLILTTASRVDGNAAAFIIYNKSTVRTDRVENAQIILKILTRRERRLTAWWRRERHLDVAAWTVRLARWQIRHC